MAGLVPSTSGAFARAMEKVLEVRITGLAVPVMTVLDPDACPLAMLPWLAWHYGLTHWSSDWPESTQRASIAAARRVLRLRGTKAGALLAIASYGSSAEIIEWQDDLGAEVGTWRVVLSEGSDPGIDPIAQAEILAALERVRPLSRPATLSVQGSAAAHVDVIAVARFAARYTLIATAVDGAAPISGAILDSTGAAILDHTGAAILDG